MVGVLCLAIFLFEACTVKTSRVPKIGARLDGDLTLGGIFPIHTYSKDYVQCDTKVQTHFVVQLEAFFWTLDYVNKHVMPGFTLGGWALDSCDNAIIGAQQTVKFLQTAIFSNGICTSNTSGLYHTAHNLPIIYGVTGPVTSVTSIRISPELAVFCIPLISTYATSTDLDDDKLYNYFLRTQPSDRYQAEAVFKFLLHMNWTLVSVMYEDTSYGESLKNRFRELNEGEQLCVENEIKIATAKEDWSMYLDTLCNSKYRANVLVLFTDMSATEHLFDYVIKQGRGSAQYTCFNGIQLVGTDGWSRVTNSFAGDRKLGLSAVTVEPLVAPLEGFRQHLAGLNVSMLRNENVSNIWLRDLFMQLGNCCIAPCDNDSQLPECNETQTLNMLDHGVENGYLRAHYTFAGVYAFAQAIQRMHKEACGDVLGLCPELRQQFNGSWLMHELKNTNFSDHLSTPFSFYNNTTSAPPRYSIFQFQWKHEEYTWVTLGTYDAARETEGYQPGGLQLNSSAVACDKCENIKEKVQNCRATVQSDNCGPHQEFVPDSEMMRKCCWSCKNCKPYTQFKNATSGSCEDCPQYYGPNTTEAGFPQCVPLPQIYLGNNEVVGKCLLASSIIGLTLTSVSGIALWLKHETPLVRHGIFTTTVTMIGIAGTFAQQILLLVKPSDVSCAAGVGAFAIFFSMTVTAMLLRIVYLSRWEGDIHGRDSISPVILLVVILFEACICIMWYELFFQPRDREKVTWQINEGKLQIGCGFLQAVEVLMVCICPWCCQFAVTLCSYYMLMTTKLKFICIEARNYFLASAFLIALEFVSMPILYAATTVLNRQITIVSSITVSSWWLFICLVLPKLTLVYSNSNIPDALIAKINKPSCFRSLILL